MPGSPHLRLVPAVIDDDHPCLQPPLLTENDETVFEWHGLVEHEPGETPCCHRRIEVTNLHDRQSITHDVVAALSTVLHGWEGYDVMVLVTITPPALHQE